MSANKIASETAARIEELEKQLEKKELDLRQIDRDYHEALKAKTQVVHDLDDAIKHGAPAELMDLIKAQLVDKNNQLEHLRDEYNKDLDALNELSSELSEKMRDRFFDVAKEKLIDLKDNVSDIASRAVEAIGQKVDQAKTSLTRTFHATVIHMKNVLEDAHEKYTQIKDKAHDSFAVFKDVPTKLEAAGRYFETRALGIEKGIVNTVSEKLNSVADRQSEKANLQRERQTAGRELKNAFKHFFTGRKQEPVEPVRETNSHDKIAEVLAGQVCRLNSSLEGRISAHEKNIEESFARSAAYTRGLEEIMRTPDVKGKIQDLKESSVLSSIENDMKHLMPDNAHFETKVLYVYYDQDNMKHEKPVDISISKSSSNRDGVTFTVDGEAVKKGDFYEFIKNNGAVDEVMAEYKEFSGEMVRNGIKANRETISAHDEH